MLGRSQIVRDIYRVLGSVLPPFKPSMVGGEGRSLLNAYLSSHE